MKIMIIDKDETSSAKLESMISKAEGETEIFSDVFRALIRLNENPQPDLMIIDINLNGIDGFQLIQKINEDKSNAQIPKIIYSEYNRQRDHEQAKALGVVDFFNKKESPEVLLPLIHTVKQRLEEASRLKSKQSSLNGLLTEICLPDVLQIINLSRKTGVLYLQHMNKQATIHIRQGEIFAVFSNEAEGESALYDLLSWQVGSFQFQRDVQENIGANFTAGFHSALLDGTKFIDELEDLLRLVPVRRSQVIEDDIDPSHWFYLSLIDNQLTLAELIAANQLNRNIAAFNYLYLERNKKCKLVERVPALDSSDATIVVAKDHLKILLVDDSKLMLTMLGRSLRAVAPGVELMEAQSGTDALRLVKTFHPDVITLDVQMPGMDGLTTLKHIMLSHPTPVVMLSALTQEGSLTTFEALRFGAVDFFTKPVQETQDKFEVQQQELFSKIELASTINIRGLRHIQLRKTKRRHSPPNISANRNLLLLASPSGNYQALLQLLSQIDGDIAAPIVVLQYIAEEHLAVFVNYLTKYTELHYQIAGSHHRLENGTCYFIPQSQYGSFNLTGSDLHLNCNARPFESNLKQNLNIAMFSVADIATDRVIGVLLAGSETDGADGLTEIRRQGGYTLVQDPSTALHSTSITAALRQNAAMEVFPINNMGTKIYNYCMADIFREMENV